MGEGKGYEPQVEPQDSLRCRGIENGGGPVYDMGVDSINAARRLLQAEPTAVLACSANSGEARFREVDEMTSAIWRFAEDQLATFTCSFGAADISRYTLTGTEGLLTADPAYDYVVEIKPQLTIGEKTITRKFPKPDQFAAALIYFSDCMLEGKEPEPSGLEGLADVGIVRAIYQSARTGRVVELRELPRKRGRPRSQRFTVRRMANGKP
jgi:predicted dehydrogenase